MIKIILSTFIFYNLIFSQNILHEDYIITIGEKIYSPFSDKPFTGKVKDKRYYKNYLIYNSFCIMFGQGLGIYHSI